MDKKKTIFMIIGMLIAVSFTFILLFLEPNFPGFLRYGYLKKLLIWIWFFLIYLYANKIEKQNFILWKDEKRTPSFYFLSVVAVVGLSFLAGASQTLLPKLGIKTQPSPILDEMISYLHSHPILLVVTCITAGIVEESIFRGYLIPRLNLIFNNKFLPVIVSALIFGLAHIGYGTIANITIPFLLGLIFGAYYQKYKNLKVLIFCHFFIDFLSLTLKK